MKLFPLFFLLIVSIAAFSQKTTRVIVVDSVTFKPLPAVFVHVKNTSRSMIADTTGIFTIKAKRIDTLMLSHVGYKNVEIPLFFEDDAILIRMSEKITLLKEVTISSRKLYPSEINPRKSKLPRTMDLLATAPWDYFNKYEKEKRKLALLMEENDRIRTFIEVVTDPTIKDELMNDHAVSENTYYDLLVKYNKQKLPVIYSNDADAIIASLHDFFDKNVIN